MREASRAGLAERRLAGGGTDGCGPDALRFRPGELGCSNRRKPVVPGDSGWDRPDGGWGSECPGGTQWWKYRAGGDWRGWALSAGPGLEWVDGTEDPGA